jgi:transcription elongation factor GreA
VADKIEYLTAAQKAELEALVAELEGPRRTEVVQAIATARAHGDLSENFEYHAAKNEQGLLEARIRTLRDRLDRSQLIDEAAAASTDAVTIGSKVVIRTDDGEEMDVEISSVGGVSPDSPLGSALLGAKAGDDVKVSAPKGSWTATVVSVGR